MRLISIGDIGLHGRVAERLRRDPASLLDPTRPLFAGAEVVLGNLEIPLLPPGFDGPVPATGAGPTDGATHLRRWGFTHLTLANNHIMDLSERGLYHSIDSLRAAGIVPFGAGRNQEEARRPVLLDGDPPLALLGFSMVCAANATADGPGSAKFELDVAREMIADLRRSGRFAVVSLHLGRMYLRRPSPGQLRAVRALLRAGATLVLCHHAHVPAGAITEHGGHAELGLGEFIFDPTAGEIRSIIGRRSRRVGVLHRAEIGPDGSVCLERVPTRQTDDGIPVPHERPEAVLRRWRRWDRELRLPPRAYAAVYYSLEWPRLPIYILDAAFIHLRRGRWRKAYAITLGLAAQKAGRRGPAGY
jgi:poly-gamma-glutamate synthesis protein (capsule biosynthesis protein)